MLEAIWAGERRVWCPASRHRGQVSQDIEDTSAGVAVGVAAGLLTVGAGAPGMSKARLVITAVSDREAPGERGGPQLRGGPVLGLRRCWPGTATEAEAAFGPVVAAAEDLTERDQPAGPCQS